METKNYLKSIRVRRNMKQEEVADLLSVSRQTYLDYENNPLQISLDILYKIIEILNGNFEEFLIAMKQDYKSYVDKN